MIRKLITYIHIRLFLVYPILLVLLTILDWRHAISYYVWMGYWWAGWLMFGYAQEKCNINSLVETATAGFLWPMYWWMGVKHLFESWTISKQNGLTTYGNDS